MGERMAEKKAEKMVVERAASRGVRTVVAKDLLKVEKLVSETAALTVERKAVWMVAKSAVLMVVM